MTEIDVLEKTALIWDWLAHNPGRSRSAAYEALRLPLDRHDFPLCEATFIPAWPHLQCDSCLLREFWPERCWVRESAYCLWQYGTSAQRNAAARAIADAARTKIHSIRNGDPIT